ncbi:MAG: RNA 2',3'-cyclic phosphodiesterase, partial [Gemmatimonadota bacterium]
APFRVDIGQLGAFPSVRRPRVIWVGVDATPELRCLKHDLEWELASLGFERETRAYHPHLTLGRVGKDARAGDFRSFETHVREFDYESELDVRTVDLMRSHLSPRGARYECLEKARLGRPAGEAAGEVAS